MIDPDRNKLFGILFVGLVMLLIWFLINIFG